jgi:hypothetical protein
MFGSVEGDFRAGLMASAPSGLILGRVLVVTATEPYAEALEPESRMGILRRACLAQFTLRLLSLQLGCVDSDAFKRSTSALRLGTSSHLAPGRCRVLET